MNSSQILSLVRTLLKLGGGMLVANGYTNSAGAETFGGIVLALVGALLSHMTHSDGGAPSGTAGAAVLPLIALAALLSGCGTTLQPGGAYAPAVITVSTNAGVVSTNVVETAAADKGLYLADASFDLAYSTVSAVFFNEQKNRALYQSISPKIKETLDQLRPQVLNAARRYTAARAAYIASPSPAGLSTVQTILDEAQRLASAAQAALAISSFN